MRYNGIKCVYCEKEFDENSDVVVCPQCGAPHHRDCWRQNGVCAFTSEHKNGYVWQFPKQAKTEKHEAVPVQSGSVVFKNGEVVVKCPSCGANNYQNDMFCMRCRCPLKPQPPIENTNNENRENPFGAYNAQPGDGYSGNNAGGYNGFYGAPEGDYGYNYYENINRFGGLNPNSTLDGIPVDEYSDYVGGAKPGKILRKISVMERFGKKISWCWPAIFVGPVWLFFRKMKKEGLIFSVILIVCSLLAGILSVTAPYEAFCKDGYNLVQQFVSGEVGREEFLEQYMELTNILAYAELSTEDGVKTSLANLFSYVASFGVPVVCSLFGMSFYRKKIKNDILKIRGECSDMQSYRTALKMRGGTSVSLCVVGAALLMLSRLLAAYLPMIIALQK